MKNRKRVYIVDCENVNAAAIKQIESFENTEVVLFLSQNVGKNAIYAINSALANTGAAISIKWYESWGKNSMDFKIVSYLTLRIKEDSNFIILSDDKGFLASVEYLKAEGFENVSLLRPSSFGEDDDCTIECMSSNVYQLLSYA